MNYALDKIKKELAGLIASKAASFSYPPDEKLGDLSLACFELAKEKKISPIDMAKQLAEKLSQEKKLKNKFQEIKNFGPYLNFFFRPEYLSREILKDLAKSKDSYGQQKNTSREKIMVEYSNANTHKEYHIGHLRNICYGEAINRLIKASGQSSIPVSYINDFGGHTAKTLWYYQKHKDFFEKSDEDKGYLLGVCYASASRELLKSDKHKEEVSRIMKAIEKRHGDNYRLWQKTRKWSLSYFEKIYKELGIKFEKTFYENEYLDEGVAMVKQLLDKGILQKSEGAIIANLEPYNLGVLPIMRSDGTSLYPVADLALAEAKFKQFKIQESYYVVDVRQGLYFKQLFKLLELMGHKEKTRHLAYEFVTLPSGMMSSRSGNVITYKSLLEEAWERTTKETKARHNDWKEKKIKTVAKEIALATIKFEMIKISAEKTIVFNIDEALKFDGYTAAYLLYALARINSLNKKSGNLKVDKIKYDKLNGAKEFKLLKDIARYPEIVLKAKNEYNPSEVARYLFELAQSFNDYYHETPILKAEKDLKEARLALALATRQTLLNGLELLNINTIEEI